MGSIDKDVGIEPICPVKRIFSESDGQERLEGIGTDCDDNTAEDYVTVCNEYINLNGEKSVKVKDNRVKAMDAI